MKTLYNYEEIFEDIPGDADNILMKIPDEICAAQGWLPGDSLTIKVENGQLVITKNG